MSMEDPVDTPVIAWRPISDLPPDEKYVLLTGPSGYIGVESFILVGRRYTAYRPPIDGCIRWLSISGDTLDDEVTHWAPLPPTPVADEA